MTRRFLFCASALLCLCFAAVHADEGEQVKILSIDSTGEMVFTDVFGVETYRIEGASSLYGEDAGWDEIQSIGSIGSGNREVTVPISDTAKYYRVVARLALEEVPVPEGGETIDVTNPLGDGESYDPHFYPEPYTITVDGPFLMDKYLVSNALWEHIRAHADAHELGYDDLPIFEVSEALLNHPVHSISWLQAVKWLNARSELAGRTPVYYGDAAFGTVYRTGDAPAGVHIDPDADGFRLPTTDQWEYAARGGSGDNRRFPWGATIDHDKANYIAQGDWHDYDDGPNVILGTHNHHPEGALIQELGPFNTTPVDRFDPNEFGLYDMAGNLREWNTGYIVRGGSWHSSATECRIGFRFIYPFDPSNEIGFRAVVLLP